MTAATLARLTAAAPSTRLLSPPPLMPPLLRLPFRPAMSPPFLPPPMPLCRRRSPASLCSSPCPAPIITRASHSSKVQRTHSHHSAQRDAARRGLDRIGSARVGTAAMPGRSACPWRVRPCCGRICRHASCDRSANFVSLAAASAAALYPSDAELFAPFLTATAAATSADPPSVVPSAPSATVDTSAAASAGEFGAQTVDDIGAAHFSPSAASPATAVDDLVVAGPIESLSVWSFSPAIWSAVGAAGATNDSSSSNCTIDAIAGRGWMAEWGWSPLPLRPAQEKGGPSASIARTVRAAVVRSIAVELCRCSGPAVTRFNPRRQFRFLWCGARSGPLMTPTTSWRSIGAPPAHTLTLARAFALASLFALLELPVTTHVHTVRLLWSVTQAPAPPFRRGCNCWAGLQLQIQSAAPFPFTHTIHRFSHDQCESA